ncbi:serine/threonine protein kinase [Gimesia algae]|uniref:Serine/threonine-protein kinase PrkC n=1 Tax=Gimesia algae TaxID=2527971 RepID=A0A517V8P8_9PLAN|nr:serine/threonine-protein kinase [Gimesia algae]QDT89368.1 Serine/threonine-protein kinase PrkC [Gimesia algae]
MLEPPSPELLHRLTKLKLCTTADVRRCRRRVRKLTRGIPAFDSVWIDALVQAQKITPFQARVLESGHPEHLAVGPYLLISELGHSPHSQTYIARVPESAEQCALKVTTPKPEQPQQLQKHFQTLLQRLQGLHHPSLVLPRVIKHLPQQVVIISHYLPSVPVSELLIRRGRFPVPVVLAIGAQLLEALGMLEQRKVIHGDIHPWNVRLTAKGNAALVDPGLASILSPELTIHAALPPRCYDGIAPELIGTGRHPDTQSDLYALGCLLWELLAGRPPFTTGDPLAKLACHQTKSVPDIRSWAPETPAGLAEALIRFTAADHRQRPADMQAAKKLWPGTTSRNVLTRFHDSFQHQTSRAEPDLKSEKPGRLPLIAALIFVLSGLSFTLLDEGARNQLLEITSKVSFKQTDNSPSTIPDTQPAPSEPERAVHALIPPPDEHGVIRLEADTVYESTSITTVGPLTLKGDPAQPAIIEIEEDSFRVVAEQLTVENVTFINRASSPQKLAQTTHALLNVTAQNVKINSSYFAQLDTKTETGSNQIRSALYWKPLDPQQRNGTNLTFQNTIFAVPRHAVYLSQTPQNISLANCLNLTSSSMLFLEHPPEIDQQLNLNLQHLTMRETGPLLLLKWSDQIQIPGTIQIEARDCVFGLVQSALIQFQGSKPPKNWLSSVGLIGEGSVASSDILIAGWQKSPGESLEELSTDNMMIEGLSTGKFRFAAELSLHPADSLVTEAQVPRKSAQPPGIQPELFPDFLASLKSLEK